MKHAIALPGGSRSGDRRAFPILELVVVLALMSLMTGAIAPSVSTMLKSKARKATLAQLESLGVGSVEYLRDTGGMPGDAGVLVADTASGWLGPYVSTAGTDTISGGSSVLIDAWSRPWQFAAAGDVRTLTSAGVNGAFGGTDDLALQIDMTACGAPGPTSAWAT